MFHVTLPKNDRLMKTQEVFSYSLWRNIFRKGSTFRDCTTHVIPPPPHTHTHTNVYKERSINENSRNIHLFALALFIYLCFYYFAKGKYFSRFHTFWFTHNYIQMTPRLTQTQQYQNTDRDLSISQHTQWRTMKTFQCVSISDTHHSTRHYFI